MHPQRIAILIAAAVGVLGCFLPWAQIAFLTITGTQTQDVVFVLGGLGLAAGFAFVKRTEKARGGLQVVISAPAAIAGVVAALKLYQITGIPRASTGLGLFVVVAASVALVAFAWIWPSAKPMVDSETTEETC